MSTSPAADTLVSALQVGAELAAISDATAWLGALGAREGWPDALRFGLELSVEEALTNVISYGFAAVDHAPQIRLEVYRQPHGRVAVRLIDNGIAFDPTGLPEPDPAASIEEARIGGHGVQLMRHFLERLSYRRKGGKNELTLVAGPKAAD